MNISNKFFQFLILFATLLISSCMPISTQTNTLAPTMLPIPSLTNVPDLTHLTTNCVEILDTPPKDVKLRNSLILSSISSESYIYNFETGEKTYLGTSLFVDYSSVSPDMQKIAYINYVTKKLVIKDVNGRVIETANGFNTRYILIKWLDNHPSYYYSLAIFNLQTKNFKVFNIEDFPNVNIYNTGYSYLYPNPQITKMIYLARIADKSIILFDMQSESQLREIYFSESVPLWTKDGDKFAISTVLNFDKYSNFADDLPYLGGDELFLVNATGKMSRLTFLATRYRNNHFSFISWSPTETYLAFDLQNKDESNFGISVLNVKTGEIINYCIHDNWGSIYWSPDGKQIAFTRWDGLSTSKANVYILDLEKTLAFKIAENATVGGWMINK